jgi:hypothetical protein
LPSQRSTVDIGSDECVTSPSEKAGTPSVPHPGSPPILGDSATDVPVVGARFESPAAAPTTGEVRHVTLSRRGDD